MKTHKILVVDDEKILAKFIKLTLSADESFEVSIVTQSSEVYSTVLEWKPDLILMDIMMPGLQGNEVAELIHQNPDLKNIKIVFITALVKKHEVNEGSVIGGRRFLPKPIDAESLMAVVKEELAIA
jgi:CheY-like chemotaxis protein